VKYGKDVGVKERTYRVVKIEELTECGVAKLRLILEREDLRQLEEHKQKVLSTIKER